ncbi:GNAT family N-acetyltransferase [Oceanispirochaeta crateris]|uniref:GNAT family N-acetyltransferase n=1 Tax=Oceanispirochaeta crateris TaxID=2518645 RepID=A0A5C1QNT7_9SPIO|nr:N-acetyltransferase [Oceanispirochaeta crateris]QEN09765.1 GNAT family N-acetyltransferase [Oceanispirochaeta crateris]
MNYIALNRTNIETEHICCAISDKKCLEGYKLKKEWLKDEFENGYRFKRINERAKVFIEYGPAEKAWIPVSAPNYFMIACFWVSGRYKGNGHGKALLQEAIQDAKKQGRDGLVTVVGKKKFHFMSDTKWLLKQGFKECDSTAAGFLLLSLPFNENASLPHFNEQAKVGTCPDDKGYVVYYTNRCPFTEYHIRESLTETASKRNIEIKVIKLETMELAQSSPTPATIFSLFHNGNFVTTDISVCMDSRFDKILSPK